ncbi:MAG: type II toxin-antitoxin system VapC family toxin [Thermofilaceae archaeon]
MKLPYDASALMNVIRLRKQDAYGLLKDSLILCLTKYEVGNALWKEAVLQGRISVEEALEVMLLMGRILEAMKTVDLKGVDQALELAYKLRVTFYDASYLVATAENDAVLVTDDAKLRRKIQENISTVTGILRKRPELSSSEEILRECKP